MSRNAKMMEKQMQKSQNQFPSKINQIPLFNSTTSLFYKGAQLIECNNINRKIMIKNSMNNIGYEISVQPDKEKCIEQSCQQQIIELINRFHQFAYFKLQIYYPNNLSQKDKTELENEYADLGLKIAEFQVNEEEFNFFQRIYKFQGQKSEQYPETSISPLLQMIILRQSYFPEIAEDAKNLGYTLNLDFHKYVCSIPTPNKQQIDFYELQHFFINNIYSNIKKFQIIKVFCKTKREAIIKFNLFSELINKNPQKFENFQGKFVLLTNETLQKIIKIHKISREQVEKFITAEQIDCLYFVVNQQYESDVEKLQYEFDRLASSKRLFKCYPFNKVVNFTLTDDQEFTDSSLTEKIQQFLQTNKSFQNLDIYITDTKRTNNQVSLTLQIVEYIAIDQTQNFKQQQIEEIVQEIKNLFQSYEIIELHNKQILLWSYFLKQQSIKESEIEYIEQLTSENQLNLFLGQQQDRRQKVIDLRQKLDIYQVEELNFSCSQGEILSKFFQNAEKDISKFCEEEFQVIAQNYNNIVQIMIFKFTSKEIHILIIFNSSQHHSDLSKIKQIIQKQVLQELQTSQIQYQGFIKNDCQKIIESIEQLLLVDEQSYFFTVYGLRKYIKSLNEQIKQLKQSIQKIQLKDLRTDEQVFLQKQEEGLFSIDIQSNITNISFLKSQLKNVVEIIEKCQSQETAFEQHIFDRDKLQNQLEDIKRYQNQNNIFFDIYELKQQNPDHFIKIMFTNGGMKTNQVFKLIQSQISEIIVQSLVVFNYYSEKFYNDYHSRQLNQLQFQSTSRENFRKFFKSYKQKLVSSFNHETSQGPKTIICVWPQNFNQFLQEKKTMSEIFFSLIEQIFKEIQLVEATEKKQIQQIAIPVKMITIFGQNYEELASLFLKELQIYLKNNHININSIYIVEDNQENIKILHQLFENNMLNSNFQIIIEDKNEQLPQTLSEFIISNQKMLNEKQNTIQLPKIFPRLNKNSVHSIHFTNKIITDPQLTSDTLEFYNFFGRVIYFINQEQVCDEENEYLNFLQIQSKTNEIFFMNRNQASLSLEEKNYYIHNYDYDGCQKYKIIQMPLNVENYKSLNRSFGFKPEKKSENSKELIQEGYKFVIVVKGNLDNINEFRNYLNSKQLNQWREIK